MAPANQPVDAIVPLPLLDAQVGTATVSMTGERPIPYDSLSPSEPPVVNQGPSSTTVR